MTPEEFFRMLDKSAIVKKSTETEKPTKLEDGDAEKLCSIVGMNTENACCVLNEVYENYKGLEVYPKELLQAVYFVIYRDCRKLYVKEKEAYKTAPDGKYKLLGKNGLMQGEKRIGITTDVFKRVTGGSSTIQEKWGMSPYDDFMSNIYDPVDMFSLKMRGDLFRRIIVRVLQEKFCSMLIDLSGDVTLFEDIYPQKREIMLVSDSNIGDFYYVIKNEFSDFCEELEIYSKIKRKPKKKESKKAKNENEKSKKNKKSTKIDWLQLLPEGVKKDLEYTANPLEEAKKYVFTYPFNYDGTRIRRAVEYFCSKERLTTQDEIECAKKKLKSLSERLKHTIIVWGTMNSLLEGITEKEIRLLDFEDAVKGKVSDIDIKNSLRVLKEGHFEELKSMKNISPRRKKGVLFYDYTVTRNTQDMVSFANFVDTHDCFWMAVCNKDDLIVRELFKGEGRYSYELNTDGQFKNFFFSEAYFNEVSVKKVLITNILAGTKIENEIDDREEDNDKDKVIVKDKRELFIPEVEKSPIFKDLEMILKNSGVTNMGSYTKILIRETIEEDPEYDEITEELDDEYEEV